VFIKTNDRIINLVNVSNINIVTKQKRVVFNMNYSIEILDYGRMKTISDYSYLDARDNDDFDLILSSIMNNQYIIDNFISHDNGYINKNEISSIKFSDKKNRIIVNLSHPVSFTDYNNNDKITSEFVYINFTNKHDYETRSKELIKELGL